MNPQETSIKHSALGWVKKSIDDNLSEIRTDLKLYIEEEDEALLGRVKERLGVIQGVLVMIEQYGAAMLTEEMVALVDFITENKQEQREQGLEVMLRAVRGTAIAGLSRAHTVGASRHTNRHPAVVERYPRRQKPGSLFREVAVPARPVDARGGRRNPGYR
jgi:hypothetical protein